METQNTAARVHMTENAAADEITGDRRQYPRYSLLRRMILISGKKRYDSYTLDISAGGLAFIAAGEIPLAEAEIQIPELRVFLPGKVVDSQVSDPRRLKRYHLAFHTPLAEAEIARICAL